MHVITQRHIQEIRLFVFYSILHSLHINRVPTQSTVHGKKWATLMWTRKLSTIRQLTNQLINESSVRLIGEWTCSISVGEVIIQYTRGPMGTSFNQADSPLL